MKKKDRLLQFCILLILCAFVMLIFLVRFKRDYSHIVVVPVGIALILISGEALIRKIKNIRLLRKIRP